MKRRVELMLALLMILPCLGGLLAQPQPPIRPRPNRDSRRPPGTSLCTPLQSAR